MNRHIGFLICFIINATYVYSQTENLIINIKNIKTKSGEIQVSVYNKKINSFQLQIYINTIFSLPPTQKKL
ncbi:hypothetical protein DCC35_17435 [Mangrovivirga cuniculi]|uniref:Uncharacterized protein n=1 Tax=Mangrovivirga cuniculi TaxID=2715131 RepID=A0A4D7JKD0_9BACT|nr:hypothetical protein DCC35_17435 [Mangrovivirga cuniculi]